MIIGLFKEALGWFLSLTEVGVVIAVILAIAVVVGMTGFWILSRFMRKLAGPPSELDPDDDRPDEIAPASISNPHA
jgi:hypothetical protein